MELADPLPLKLLQRLRLSPKIVEEEKLSYFDHLYQKVEMFKTQKVKAENFSLKHTSSYVCTLSLGPLLSCLCSPRRPPAAVEA